MAFFSNLITLPALVLSELLSNLFLELIARPSSSRIVSHPTILTFSSCFFTNLFSFKAQNSIVPDKINYQAIAHSSNGQTLNNQTIDVLIGIHIQSSSGTLVYQEEHNVTTNDYGLFTLSIGDGTPSLNPFNSIGWEDQNYYLNVQVDNGFGYEDLGSQQLVTVPYAFHARTVEVDNVGHF